MIPPHLLINHCQESVCSFYKYMLDLSWLHVASYKSWFTLKFQDYNFETLFWFTQEVVTKSCLELQRDRGKKFLTNLYIHIGASIKIF